MAPDWLIRKYSDRDEYKILDLFKIVFKEERKVEHWIWQNMNNPAGKSLIMVADDNNNIISHMSLSLYKMKINDSSETGSQAIDLATHPKYRKKGLFVKLGKELLDSAGKEGVILTYGFPNKLAHKGHLKYGWFDVCEIPILIKRMNLDYAVKKRIKNQSIQKILIKVGRLYVKLAYITKKPRLTDISIKEITEFNDDINDFWKKCSKQFSITIERNKSYLNWRYIENPNHNYKIYIGTDDGKIVGYIILKIEKKEDIKEGYIIDILAHTGYEFFVENLITKSIKYFEENNVDLISCWMLENTTYYEILKKYDFNLSHTIPLIARINSSGLSKDFIMNKKNWYVVMGDSDIL